jgi:hypothetical protein
MAGRLDEVLVLDVVAHSYGVAVLWRTPAGALPLLPSGPGEEETVYHVVLKRNTTIPTKKKTTFACAEGQTAAFVQVFRGERAMTRDNVLIFALDFAVPSGAPGGVELEVDIDLNASVAVVATVVATGEKHKLQHVGEPNRPEEARMRFAALDEAEAVRGAIRPGGGGAAAVGAAAGGAAAGGAGAAGSAGATEAAAQLRQRTTEITARLVAFDEAIGSALAWHNDYAHGASLAMVEARRRTFDSEVSVLALQLARAFGVVLESPWPGGGGAAAVGAGAGGAAAGGAGAAGSAGATEAAARLRQRVKEISERLAAFEKATCHALAWLDKYERGATVAEIETQRRTLNDKVRALALQLARAFGAP